MSKQTDALTVLEEVAVSLKESAEQIEAKTDFDNGRLLGYYEALSTLSSQCSVAGKMPDGMRPQFIIIDKYDDICLICVFFRTNDSTG
jgi:hypothetical protein